MTELFTLLVVVTFAVWFYAIYQKDKAERKQRLYRSAEAIGRYRVGGDNGKIQTHNARYDYTRRLRLETWQDI